jgi:hypothetical protein
MRNSSPHATSWLSITAHSILVSLNRFIRLRSERAMTETTTVVSLDLRGLFFLRKKFSNLGLRKCS